MCFILENFVGALPRVVESVEMGVEAEDPATEMQKCIISVFIYCINFTQHFCQLFKSWETLPLLDMSGRANLDGFLRSVIRAY